MRVKTCCGFSLAGGSMAIAVINMMSCAYGIYNAATCLKPVQIPNEDKDEEMSERVKQMVASLTGMYVWSLVTHIIGLSLSFLLAYAVAEAACLLLGVWLNAMVVWLLNQLIFVAVLFVKVTDSEFMYIPIAGAVIVGLTVILNLFFMLVVWSFCLDLTEDTEKCKNNRRS